MPAHSFGVILTVSLTVGLFAGVAVPILAWCWTYSCETHAPELSQGGSWRACDIGNDGWPSWCALGQGGKLALSSEGRPNCKPITSTVALEHGSTSTRETIVCEVVAGAKDPNDNWH